jgi:hypothetical protein
MQNSIVKEFADNPRVVVAVYDEGGRLGETREWLEIFWSNYFLRGGVIFDEDGTVSRGAYGQPATGLPFGRGFIIDQDLRVALPYFGHQPAMVIEKIHELLGTTTANDRGPGERTGSGAGLEPLIRLGAGYPNPFASLSMVTYSLSRPAHITLRVYSPLGREVRTLVAGVADAGSRAVIWDGRGAGGEAVPAGVYFYRLEGGGETESRMIVKVHPR